MAYAPDPDAPKGAPFAVVAVVLAFVGLCMTVAAAPLLARVALHLMRGL